MNKTRKYYEWGNSDPERQRPRARSLVIPSSEPLDVSIYNLESPQKPGRQKGPRGKGEKVL